MTNPLKTLWTVLTRERGRRVVPRRRRKKERGIALVMVMIAISITLVISNQFGTTTNVDMMAAANYRDQMRAHFLARSALNLSELVIRIQQRLDNSKEFRGVVQITDFADQIMLAFCGGAEEVQAAVGFSPGDVKGLGADIGVCGLNNQIQTEDAKINLNCANGNDATAATLKSALDALVFFPAYDPVFEESDAENYRRDRTTQVSALMDYIDTNSLKNRERGTTEDYGYESLKDPYRMKGNYVDSVGELKLVRGVDDRFWTLFGSAFTVYGACKTNLSALSNTQLIAAILYLAAKNPADPLLLAPQKLFALAGLVAKSKQFGMTFSNLDDFIDFVKDPGASVGGMLTGAGSGGASAATSAVNQLTGGEKLGMELDKTKLGQIATAGPRRTYRLEAYGEIERKQKNADGSPVYPPIRATINGVWDTKVVNQNARKTPQPNGAWVFLREE
ncbi:MAG: general secretion pathway protein GspK [Deltaproteobacteria bacterium]|nr:general secretion pathway protein GspK [Deltaproteobacteria bacterium]